MKFIKDPIHGNIICSLLEFEIFSLPTFNRLHYILQNSMAFLVYPTNKTTRFSHSVGVCHLSGQIYKYGIINSQTDITEKYIISKGKILKEYSEEIFSRLNKVFTMEVDGKISYFFDDNDKLKFDRLYDYLDKLLGKYFLCENNTINQNITDKSLLFTNAILLQATRLFGLFHDYGHLPYSHLFEFALGDFFDEIDENSDLYNKIEPLIDSEETDGDIHEMISKKLTILTLYLIQDKYKRNNREDIAKYIIIQLLIEILDTMFDSRETKFKSLYDIVSSDLDADRLDYTIRDLYMSGLMYNVDISRIIKLFSLQKNDDEHNYIKGDTYSFYPAIQSLYDIDLLFNNRQMLYKMILNHHKVKKFDTILLKLIVMLLNEEVKNKSIDTNNLVLNDLNDLIDTLQSLSNLKDIRNFRNAHIERLLYKFAQITDYWLLDKIKSKTLEKRYKTKKKDNNFIKFSEELFGGTKTYKSIYKRENEFNSFIDSLLKDNNNLHKEDIIEFIEKNQKELEKNNIFLVYTKNPKYPKKLYLVDLKEKNFNPIKYEPKQDNYNIPFFIYSSYKDKDTAVDKIKTLLKKRSK